jgi:hypothetical protein
MATLAAGLSAGTYRLQSLGEEQETSGQILVQHGRASDATPASNQRHGAELARLLKPAHGEHPLEPCLRWAKSALADIQRIKDYSCTVVKRERVGSELLGPESMAVKVRHEPFSVYMRFSEPAKLSGREVIYVAGQNHDKLLAHVTGVRHRLLGTVALSPTGSLAMRDNRYPITELGIRRLVERLIKVGENDQKDARCEVRVSRSSLDGRPCMCIEVEHPHRQADLKFHLARIYVDAERNLPLHYEAFDWPTDADETPALIEQYTYRDLKVNRGFDDQDFDPENPDYAFSRGGDSKTAMAH